MLKNNLFIFITHDYRLLDAWLNRFDQLSIITGTIGIAVRASGEKSGHLYVCLCSLQI